MSLDQLNHFSIRLAPDAIDETARFYTDVLGLVDGDRPPFEFPGHWLYCGGLPVVHLIGTASAKEAETSTGTGSLDHIAFSATGLGEMRERLAKLGVGYREREVPGAGLHQIFVYDPTGIQIELNYPADDTG